MNEITATLEAVLFAAAEPVDMARLTEATGYPAEDVQGGLDELSERLASTGLRLTIHNDTYQLVTAPEGASAVQRYLQGEARSELSRAAIETLAMVAYRGPITKDRLDSLRGVSSDAMLRNLISRGLVSEAGQADEPGRPTVYIVTHRFLHHFGLSSLAELPPLDDAA